MTHWIVFYDYVEGIVEKRAPYREAHLALARAWKEDGRMLMGGAVGDPPHGAILVFTTNAVQEFIDADPYIEAGLVTGHRVEPWNAVIR